MYIYIFVFLYSRHRTKKKEKKTNDAAKILGKRFFSRLINFVAFFAFLSFLILLAFIFKSKVLNLTVGAQHRAHYAHLIKYGRKSCQLLATKKMKLVMLIFRDISIGQLSTDW